MTLSRILAVLAMTPALALPAAAQEPDSCREVVFSDVGWSDITATTAIASTVLQALGYETETRILSVPVTYTALSTDDVDVFLGNWMPTMEADIAPYRDAGTVDTDRREIHAGHKQGRCRPGDRRFRRHRRTERGAGRQDLWHRAGQRRQPPAA